MKNVLLIALCCAFGFVSTAQNEKLKQDTVYLQPVEVQAIRATAKSPFAKTDITEKEIEKLNLGQDLPFLLNLTPSVVVSSDAGNGIGYTGIRIRGTDATRINVTLNGIPYNDPESQGTFFVDLPDISSSANSIQVQRGVGTSTNGAGAFGASINLSTNEIKKDFYAESNNSVGSFNSWKNNIQFGTGIIGKHFTIDGRLSSIRSDGYIDRAKTNLQSGFVSAAYVSAKNSLRLNIFSGKEKTYQAWNGVPENKLATDRTFNSSGTEKPDSPYDNETDNYLQTHYQLFYNHSFNEYWKANLAVFFTKGRGYYEQYKANKKLADYGLSNYFDGSNTIKRTDLIRRLWLDNDFYGSIYSFQYNKNKTGITIGGGYNAYDGIHYGEIIWAKVQAAVPANYHWYDLTAYKKDFASYVKWTEQLNSHWQSFADVQYRYVDYRINGFRYNPGLRVHKNYSFLNPKVGLIYTDKNFKAYVSYARAAKEPNRNDFEAGKNFEPKPEILNDYEMGFDRTFTKYSYGINLYYMKYRNQLVLTGQINDVGAYTRTNISNSFRAGIELQGKIVLANWLQATGNTSFSSNKILDYTDYIDNYDNNNQKATAYSSTDISFSPSVVSSATLDFTPCNNIELSLVNKYVSRQYLDNTGMQSRSLDPYYLQDIRFRYVLQNKLFKETALTLQVNNVFNRKYSANGYSFSYIYGGQNTTENYYYPMAGTNVMAGVNIKF